MISPQAVSTSPSPTFDDLRDRDVAPEFFGPRSRRRRPDTGLGALEAGPTAFGMTTGNPAAPSDAGSDASDDLAEDTIVDRVLIRTADGETLAGHWHHSRWMDPTFVTVIHPATAVPASYYHAFAAWLTGRGHAVLTYDYRGIGASRSGSIRSLHATMDDWALFDAPAAVDLAQSRYDQLPLLLVGHSMGGQAVMMSDIAQRARAVAFVGVGSGYWGHCEGRTRASRLGTWNLTFPALLATVGYVPGWAGMGEDLPAGVAAQWRQRCLTPTYFEPPLLDRIRHNLEQSTARFLSIALTDDDYINPAASADFVQHFRPGQIDFRTVTPEELGQRAVGHFKAFRPAAGRALWPMLAEFLEGEVG